MSGPQTAICPFCASSNVETRYSFPDSWILRCRACELMWLYPELDAEQLKEVYDPIDYFQNRKFLANDNHHLYGYHDYFAEKSNKQRGYRRVVEKMLRLLGGQAETNPRWLDVGCGLGFLLEVARESGFAVQGTEFSAGAVEHLRESQAFPVEQGELRDLDLDGPFDVISLFDVIEHLRDPVGDLRRLRELSGDGGHLVIQTMDSYSLMSRLLGSRLEDFRRTREHLFFFSRASLRRILAATGWEMADVASVGHTFQVGFLIDRLALISPLLSRPLRLLLRSERLLEANVYLNPRTKMIVHARPAPSGGGG